MKEFQTIQDPEKSDMTIGEIVSRDFRTAKVFEDYEIDFCCGGQKTLAAACKEKGLDPEKVLREIANAKNEAVSHREDYRAWDLPFLADYIVNTHHAYLNGEMEKIAAYAHKIAEVHGDHHEEVIEIATIFDRIFIDMVKHLREEEEVLFPAIKRSYVAGAVNTTPEAGDRRIIRDSLETLYREHEEVGEAVHRIRQLSNDYEIPADVCNTFVVTYKKLKEFEDDLHKHVHLENNILFPKASNL